MGKNNCKLYFIGIVVLILLCTSFIYIQLPNYIQLPKKHCYTKYEYKTEYFTLDDSNLIKNLEVIDYLCSPNVKTSNIPSQKHFYASTWRDGNIPHSEGECMIKYSTDKKEICELK